MVSTVSTFDSVLEDKAIFERVKILYVGNFLHTLSIFQLYNQIKCFFVFYNFFFHFQTKPYLIYSEINKKNVNT